MSSFDDYRKKLQNKYGTPEKASEKEDEKTKKATTGSSFSEYRSKLTEKYSSKASSSDLENWFTDADATLRAMQEYHTQNEGKYTPQYGGEMSQKIRDLMYSSGDIYSYLQNNKNEIGNYDEVSRAFAEYRNVLQQNQIYNYNKSRYYSQFESEDAYNKWYEDNKKVEEYKSVLDAEDFEKYSYLGKRVKNPDWKDAHAPFEILGWTPFGDGDDIGNMVTFAEANGANAFTASASSMIGGGRASEYQEIVNLINGYMEDDEKKIYNYYVGKGDTEKANEYLAYITDILRQRQGGVIAAKGNDKPAELAVSFFAGAQGGFQGIENFVKGVAGTEGTDISSLQYASDEMRQDNTGLWMAMNDVASSAGNMTPAIIAGGVATAVAGPGVGQAVGATVTGISSAGSSYADMIREGYGVDQARKYGVMVGAAEGGLSYLFSGISKLGGKVTGNVVNKVIDGVDSGIARFFTEFAINSGSEALEEGAQAILDPIFKKLATGEDFEGIDWSEVAYSSLLGALSAGMLEGVPNAAGAIHSNYKANVAHGGLSNMGAIEALADTKSIKGVAAAYKEGKQAVTEIGKAYVNEALEIDPENAHAQRMQARLEAGKDVSGYQINRLIEANQQVRINQDKAKIKSAVEAELTKLGETGDVGKIADVITKIRAGEDITKAESKVLTESKYGRRVSMTSNPEIIEQGGYDTAWAEKIGTEVINEKAYNKGLHDLADEVAGVTADENIPSATNNTPAKEIATESEFKASEDGKTRIGDMEVSVKEIASVKDGKVVLRLDDDSTVDARDVDFGSTAEVQLYENVAHMGWTPDVANSFVKGYDGSIPVNNYAQGFSEAYRFGELGIPMVDVTNGVFSSGLPEATRNLAYGYGKADAKVKVESKQAKIASVGTNKAGNNASLGKKKGGLHNTLKPTNETQRASLKTLGVLADTLGIDIYTFESKEVNGKRQGANGWYDPTDNSIHIDLFAGKDGKGTMLFTAAHELTHHIREKLPTKFKAFADFLFEQYAEKGISVSERIEAKIKDLEANGRTKGKTEAEIYDLAYEEVVADSCESFLADGNAVAKIAELKAKDKSLWQTIKDFINKLVARIKAAYEGLSPDSVEGRLVAEMLDNAEKLKAMWAEMVVEASEVETTTELLGENGIIVNSKTDSATLYSVRDVLSDADRKKVSKALAERFDVTQSEAVDWLKAETSLASLILNPKYSQYLDYTADPNEEAIKSNSDYPQGTVDFSNICKKRRDFTEVMNRVLRNFPNHVFAATDLAKIRTIMEQEGMEVACAICYVEDRRQLDSVVAQNFIDSLALYREGSKTKPDGTPFNANQLKAFSLIEGDTYTPSIYELISLEGRNSLKAKNPAMEEAWVKFNNARGMQSVRLLLNDAEYKRQILKYSQSVVKRKNDLGGLRIYSFSDMEMFHLIDIIQVITDSAAVGLSLQGYTKVNEYAKAVKDTGEKLNRSLIPKGDLGYHMENGKVVLDFDTTEGIDINHPDFFDNIDNPNIGNIVIGINATQIKAAMTSKFIDQIIPFHTGQSNEVLGEKGIAAWDNYKDFQSERDVKTNKKSSHQINIYTEVINAAEAEGKPITNKVDFVNKFLEVCRENNLIPRFSDFLNVDENGNYVYTEGYHKFLVDFKTFDQNTGEYLPQMPVKPVFDNEYITSLLTDYVKSQKAKDTEFTKAMPKVLDRITKEIVSPAGGVKYSDRASYAPTFYSYMGKVVDGIKSEKVGANGVVSYLKGKGVKAEEIKWSGIEAWLEGKKSVTKAELQEFVAGSQLAIEEEMSGSAVFVDEDGNTYTDTEFKDRAYAIADEEGIDRSRVKFILDADGEGTYLAYAGNPLNGQLLIADLQETNGMLGRWGQYKIDGGTNYRELVFKMPDSSYSNRAMRVHWGEDAEGVLAHARIQDITTKDGKKMLFIEEIQSDWHNEGHQKGYTTKEYEDAVAVYDKLAEDYANKRRAFNKYVRSGEFRSDPDEVSKKKFDWLRRKMDEAEKRMQDAERDIDVLKEKGMGDVPDAPFRTNYHEYVLKRLLRMAAEEGYDSIGWTPADIQSERWSDEYAEGYRIEYDQDIPKFFRKYGKKWGATVGTATVSDTEVWSMDIPDSMKDSVLHEGQVLYSDRNFASQVDAVLNGADTNSTHLKLMDTPSLLQEAGLPNLPVLMTANHLKKITATTGHGLDVEMVKKLPEYISSPVMIADSLTRDDSVVIITEAIDSESRPVIAAIMLNGTGQLDNKYVDANIMTSAYGRNNFQSFLDRIADGNSVIYWDKEKSQDLSVNLGVQFPNVITSLDSGVIIHQAKAFVNAQNEKNLNSDRPAESVSNRSLLANALESVAQNDIERNKLSEYKAKIALIESEQAKLSEIRAQIKELSFAKGPRDVEAIKSLQFKEKQSANRINTYDRQLLTLEATTALKGVLDREKKMAYKRAEQKGKEALAAYRERATKTQRELITRYQESRKKGVEGRKQTAMRLKVKDIVNELNQYLLKGTKDKHVPIELQGVVAEALAVVNMDTVGAEERIAKLGAELRVAKSLEEMQKITKKIEHIREIGGNMEAKISRLKTAYDNIINSDDPLIANSHDAVISSSIEKVIEVVGDTPIRDMSLYQLEAVYDMYKMVLTSIRNTNKAFKAAKNAEISTIANGVISELMDQKRKYPYSTKAMQTMSEFDWNNLKPVYAFERIGSANFTKVFDSVREGEDVWAKDMSEAQAFREDQFQKYKYDSWDFDKRFGFTSTSGKGFELSLGQIMSLYAFSKRDQAGDHLKYGGFVFDGLTEVKVKNKAGRTKTYQLKDATAYNLSEETLAEIIGKLTPEQKAFVDVMQDYLSTVMGEKGNEVSLALYDVKLFKEKYYFPLKSAPQYLAKAKEQAQGDVKVKNSGFTKETAPKAKNPIVLSSFMDVWAGHVNDMSMYHAFVLPLEDFYRVYNYHTPANEKMEMMSVGASLENAHGQAAVNYIDQLLKDLNGGARSDPRDSVGKALMANFKKASVMASLSVVIQQPSAIVRAQALVDAKYFVGKPSGKHGDNWAEVKKYAPVAIIKEMGYFDTGMGKSSVAWLKGEKTFMDKVDDATSKLPALADEVTWVAIWNAVKRETLHTHTNLRPNSEEFLKAAGERFTEVIVKTQVYDSTLARSANMRSKSTWMNMVTSFMAEPTTSINLLQDSFRKGKRGKYTLRVMGAVYGSVLLNSALVSIVYAMRDDDEDETFLEKYLSRFTTEMVDGINPLTYIPLVKDVWSLLQGYDIERADMSLISDVVASLQQMVKLVSKDTSDMDEDGLAEHRKAINEAVLKITDSLSSCFGVPLKNVRRDLNGIINAIKTIKKDATERDTTAGSLGDNVLEDVKDSVPVWGWFPDESKGDKLYDAIVKGDTAYVDRLKSGYKTGTAYQSAVRKALRENDPRIKEAAEARYNGNIAEYMRIAKAIIAEGNFKQDDVVSAINTEITAMKKGEETAESTSSDKVTSIYKLEDYYDALAGRDQATAYVVKEDLIKTDVANGKDREEAEADFNSKFASHLRELFEDGDISASEAERMLSSYGGKSEEDASSKVQYWEFKKRYPDYDLSEEAVEKYYNEVEPYGIGVGVYYDYSKQRAKCKGADSDGDGKTDSGSVKREVLTVIDSLPITYKQKDALYYLNGWSASTIREAPWH